MKFISIAVLFAYPICISAFLAYTGYTLAENYNLLAEGQNYIPLFCAIGFFAFIGLFVLSANMLFPNDEPVILPIKRDVMPMQPCELLVNSHSENYNSYPLFTSLNIG